MDRELTELLRLPYWVFDMDGVVVDSSRIHTQAFRDTFENTGIPFDDYKRFAGMSTRQVVEGCLKQAGRKVQSGFVQELVEKKQRLTLEMMADGDGLSLIPGIIAVLDLAEYLGKCLCLVSSASRERMRIVLKTLDLDDRFQHIVAAEDAAFGKPDPAPYLALFELTEEHSPSQYLVFEDSEAGLYSAKGAGMSVVHYCPDNKFLTEADAAVLSFDEVISAAQEEKWSLPKHAFPHNLNPGRREVAETLGHLGLLGEDGAPRADRLARPVVAILPAAGKGTRLNFNAPKVLFPVDGVPILRHIYDRISDCVDEICLIVNPDDLEHIETYTKKESLSISFAIQHEPTGMGDAILCAQPAVGHLAEACDYLIIWGDQASVSRDTVLRCLLWHQSAEDSPFLTFPTCRLDNPYIHYVRDDAGEIVSLLQRREGDAMPDPGESDCGVFIVRGRSFFGDLRKYRTGATPSTGTKEFNFLPFIVWLVGQGHKVYGLPIAAKVETLGINTLEDAELISRRISYG